MKTGYWKADWLVPLVGIAVVGGSLMAANKYVNLEQRAQANEALAVTLDHLYQDQRVSVALKAMRDGQVEAAAQRLDLVLCQNIIALDSQLESADPQTRGYILDGFRRIALSRPKTMSGTLGGLPQQCEDQITAERILARALGQAQIAQTH